MWYQCPASYECRCAPGTLVRLSTVRRHRDLAQIRLRRQRQNPFLTLVLPGSLHVLNENGDSEESGTSSTSTDFAESSSNCSVDHEKNETATSTEDSIAKQRKGTFSALQGSSVAELSTVPESSSVLPRRSDGVPNLASEADQSPACSSSAPGRGHESDESSRNDLNEDWTSHDDIADSLSRYGWLCQFYLRHNLTMSAMDALLAKEFPDGPRSWKTVRSNICAMSGIRITRHPYCSWSHELLKFNEVTGLVSSCTHPLCSSSSSEVFEIRYISVWDRLVCMLQNTVLGPIMTNYVRDSFWRQRRERSSSLIDFFSGSGFQDYAEALQCWTIPEDAEQQMGSRTVNVFLFMSTDGAPCFQSSVRSFWPVLLYVGNIPPDKRYQKRFVLPVMCIPGNPQNLESFLEPLFDELEDLSSGRECTLWNGQTANVSVHLIHEMADLPAKKKLCHLKGVNSYCPCPYCEIRGQFVASKKTIYYPDHVLTMKRSRSGAPRSSKRVLWLPEHLPIRKEKKILETFDALDVLRDKGDKKGLHELMSRTGIVGEPEAVKRFASIRPYMSMPIDLMHLLFENVAPQLVGIWLGDVDTEREHSYLSSRSAAEKVDATLESAGSGLIDSFRRPRGLKHRRMWKADEWRTFVVTTSLVALHDALPKEILDGWQVFVTICELSMLPVLQENDIENLSAACLAFFRHYSNVYYQGRPQRVHLMKYTIHLILHIPHSTTFCGPLVCLSQFPVERYIGVVKGATKAKHKFSESVTEKWIFEQAVRMCELKSGAALPLLNEEDDSDCIRADKRSATCHLQRYKGYYLKGPCRVMTVKDLNIKLGYCLRSRLERYYQEDLRVTRQMARQAISDTDQLKCWNRLWIQREDEWTPSKYSVFNPNRSRRSRAFFAAEFQVNDDGCSSSDVYFGRVSCFLEHHLIGSHPRMRGSRILVLADWASRGLQVGKQGQVYANGKMSSQSAFPTTSVEDVSCIMRNVACIERDVIKNRRRSTRCYFVDDRMSLDSLLSGEENLDGEKRRLCGIGKLR